MPADVLETLLGALRLALMFFTGLFLPVLLQMVALFLAGRGLERLASRISPWISTALGLVGTPVHELSHALANLITLCGVTAITPLIDSSGQASVSTRRTNPLRNLIAPVAPLFGGTLVLWLTGLYVIPGLFVSTASLPQMNLDSAASLGTVLTETLQYLGRFLETVWRALPGLEWRNWRTYVGLYIALSVGAAIAPSSTDLKNLARSLPLILVVVVGLFVWLYVSGDAQSQFLLLQDRLVPHLLQFSTALTYAFILSVFGVLVFLPLRLWARLRGR